MWTLEKNGVIPRFDDGWPKYTWKTKEEAERFAKKFPKSKYRVVPHPGRQ